MDLELSHTACKQWSGNMNVSLYTQKVGAFFNSHSGEPSSCYAQTAQNNHTGLKCFLLSSKHNFLKRPMGRP